MIKSMEKSVFKIEEVPIPESVQDNYNLELFINDATLLKKFEKIDSGETF